MTSDSKYNIAKSKVKSIKSFYEHILSFIFVNLLLFIINISLNFISGSPLTSELWFYWITIFWGIGLFIHALGTFWEVYMNNRFLSKEWEEKKIEEFMKKR